MFHIADFRYTGPTVIALTTVRDFVFAHTENEYACIDDGLRSNYESNYAASGVKNNMVSML